MAKPPAKRRGIMLDPRADTADSLTELSSQPAQAADTAGDPAAIPGLLERLHRINAEQEARWQQHTEQMQQQLQALDAQRERLARQARRRGAGFGVSLSLLALAAVAALGLHFRPGLRVTVERELRHLVGLEDPAPARAEVSPLVPELQAVREQVSVLARGVEQVAGTVASVREEVSTVRSELGSLRRTVDTLPTPVKAAPGDQGQGAGAVPVLSRNAGVLSDRYRSVRPMMPW